ncbi:MAG TPA: quinone oxidoreductase [SAR324 cluster bacterium]|jgi:NADPH2:quinone reductase|nr:quinone oxidoreductase [Deltaproteobacteria bacterium]MDP6092028.1 quinone oxidoreductase [SAR324 cluster bacterium]MDP6245365.1 quinone oxidoreductase [SAR324 cluster bacterium]MDP6464627.1 quinone oxidoreductase [SAR324 cluster bacterium]MDP6638371.1 quinone oxidoreductase [SAR324 cluster bacterium]|tara:strand:- start:495 stop:1466 length:972 start_codon:yes stop_codon:yes gene_type:complete
MNQSIQIYENGGPEVLRWEESTVGRPGPGEVLLRHTAVGLNFIDIYQRSGLYPLELPKILGMEGAGVIEETGEGVENFKPGQRVAYAMQLGAYCERRTINAEKLVILPDGIEDQSAAAMMLKGMTVMYLLRRTHVVQKGETILVNAAAGGVGLILCQWASHLGAEVIGCVGSEEKADLARKYGCTHTILYREENIVSRVREITEGKGVPVVYDSVGKETFMSSIDCLAAFGKLVSFGNASGPVEPFNPAMLGTKGSLFFTRQTLATHIASRELFEDAANQLFEVVLSGGVQIVINRSFSLSETRQAHEALESRRTTGSTILLP